MGIASVQAAADLLSLAIGIPLAIKVTREIREKLAQMNLESQPAADVEEMRYAQA